MSVFEKVLNKSDEIELKVLNRIVDEIDNIEPEIQKLSDEELKNMTNVFRNRLKQGETLDDILIEAFAVCREASKRVLGMRQYRVQLIGGIVLHQGRIAEMKTGEGKTLVAVAPVYLHALLGKGAHVVTVNDYLAKRDKELMEPVYEFLGMSVGVILQGQDPLERKAQYSCDITYGTNNEYGFDYLKDNSYCINYHYDKHVYEVDISSLNSENRMIYDSKVLLSGDKTITQVRDYKITSINGNTNGYVVIRKGVS